MIGAMVKALHTSKIEEQMADQAAKILQEEIDWEVMIDILTEVGWTKVNIDWPRQMSAADAHAVKEWCRNNLQGNYNGRNRIWLFEKSQDAIMFSLRWS